jgi:hypothetical protein
MTKKAAAWWFIVILALTLSECTFLKPVLEREPLYLSLSVRPWIRESGKITSYLISLWGRNLSDRPITLAFGNHPVHDIIVTNDDGTEVWRWSHGKVFSPVPKVKTLNPHEQFEFITEWDQRNNEGHLVPPGTYWVRGILYFEPEQELQTKPEKLIITPRSPLALRLEVPTEVTLWAFGEYVPLKLGHNVPLKLKVKNRGDQPMELTFRGHPAYDFVVSTNDGIEVWRWSQEQSVQPIYKRRTLQPGEELEFAAVWDQRDNQGRPVSSGRYEVRGVLYLEPGQLETELVSLAIGPGLPLGLELEMPSSVRTDETVSLKLKVTNASNRVLELWTLAPPCDFIVTTQDGKEVWRWARGKAFPATLFPLTLHPGEVKVYEMWWDQLDNEGYPVPPDMYLIRGIFSASQFSFDGVMELVLTEPQKLIITP